MAQPLPPILPPAQLAPPAQQAAAPHTAFAAHTADRVDRFDPKKVTLFSDIDGTWMGKNQKDRYWLQDWMSRMGRFLNLIYITGRPDSRTHLERLEGDQWSFPLLKPAFKILENGAYIINTALNHMTDGRWDSIQRQSGFNKSGIQQVVREIEAPLGFKTLEIDDLGLYPDRSPTKMSLLVPVEQVPLTPQEQAADILDDDHFQVPQSIQHFVSQLDQRLRQQFPGMQYVISPPYVSELINDQDYVFIDIAPPTSNKGSAINYMIESQGLDPNQVIVAGNSGNDISMMQNDGRRVIVVGDDSQLIDYAKRNLPPDKVVYVDEPSSGLAQGIQHHLSRMSQEQQAAATAR